MRYVVSGEYLSGAILLIPIIVMIIVMTTWVFIGEKIGKIIRNKTYWYLIPALWMLFIGFGSLKYSYNGIFFIGGGIALLYMTWGRFKR